MNRKQHMLCLNTSPDPISIEELLEMPPGIYIGTTLEGQRAVVKISQREPIVNMQVTLGNTNVHVAEYYSDGTVKEYDKQIVI